MLMLRSVVGALPFVSTNVSQTSYDARRVYAYHQSRKCIDASQISFDARHNACGGAYAYQPSRKRTIPRTAAVSSSAVVENGTNTDRKSILLLNQRKLPKQILQCRADDMRALAILENAYPHFSLSLEVKVEFGALQGTKLCYEELIRILHGADFDESTFATFGDPLIIDGKSVVAAMEVLQKAQNLPAALHLLMLSVAGVHDNRRQRRNFSEEQNEDDHEMNALRQIYKSVFSLLGHTQLKQSSNSASRLIMHLLDHHMPIVACIQPGAEIYHTAINSFGKMGECDRILELLEAMEWSQAKLSASPSSSRVPPVDRMAYQTAIASLARNGHCHEATQVLHRMQTKGFEQPDTNIYNELLIGVAKESGRGHTSSECNPIVGKPWHQVALDLLHDMETSNMQPTEQAFNSVVQACGKEGQWQHVARVAKMALSSHRLENRHLPSKSVTSPSNVTQQSSAKYFQNLQSFRKVGKGKEAFWEIGRYSGDGCSDMTIGIQPHRNPLYNGISLVFYDQRSMVKLGRMLLKNEYSSQQSHESNREVEPHYYSSLVGMEVNKMRRGEGLSKIFVAIWLRLCLETHSYPRAGVMNKPLISYVLVDFGFKPQNGGSRVELVRLSNNDSETDGENYNPQYGLYSPSAKSLQGLFSQRVLRTQNIAILDYPPPPASRKREIWLKTRFEHPIAILDNAVQNDAMLKEHEKSLEVTLDTEHPSEQTSQSSVQRKLLDERIHYILKTNANGAASTDGQLEFLATNITLLKRAFFIC